MDGWTLDALLVARFAPLVFCFYSFPFVEASFRFSLGCPSFVQMSFPSTELLVDNYTSQIIFYPFSIPVFLSPTPNSNQPANPPSTPRYHDWEHFSSIRNLRGPHSGLPNIKETPAETVGLENGDNDDDVDPSMLQRDAAKERKKERERKEKERKEKEKKGRGLEREKEKEKEKAKEKEKDKEKSVPLKVKIKLPTPLSSTSSLSSISSSSSSVIGIGVDVVPPPAPMPIQPPQVNPNGNGVKQDPTLIPLPTSRAASPFPSSSHNAAPGAAIQPPALMPTPLRESHTAELGGDDAAGPSSSMMMTTNNIGSTGPEAVDAIPVTTPTTATTEPTNTNTDDLLSTTARGQYRSPKRTFDESSASGGEDPEGGRDRDGGEGGRERRRRRVGSLVGTAEAGSAASLVGAAGVGGVDCGTPPPPLLRSPGMNVDVADADVDIDVDVVDVEMDADMPGLTTSSVGDSSSSSLSSSPLSSSPLSSEAGSEAWSASASPAPEAEGEEVDMDPTTPVAASKPYTNGMKTSMEKPKRFPHPYEAGGGGVEKQLTRRQRKALGLPKQRNVPPYLASGAKGASASAGKIVIPGGRWTGRGSSSAAAIPGVADPTGVEEEWRRNGTGRVDVRGFRELKI